MGGATLVLTAADVDAVLGMEACIDAVEDAFRLWARGEVPGPGVLGVHVEGGSFHIKAATLRGDRHYFAAKTNGNFPGNPERNRLPSIQGLIVLCDADAGTPLAIIDSSSVTEIRTAAATAVAARHLARAGSVEVTLVGCGAQAPSQLRALAAVRPLARVHVLDRHRPAAEALAVRMCRELGVPVVVAKDLAAALAASDVCITCTTSRIPVLGAEMVPPGAFVAAVGADNPDKHEIAPELMRASKVVVDSLAQCREIGDLHHAIAANAMSEHDVHAELGAVVAGTAPGREGDDEIIVFDSTGTGLQDVAAAAIAFERASAGGRGTRVDFTAGRGGGRL
jgi:alanine dehydrogenase